MNIVEKFLNIKSFLLCLKFKHVEYEDPHLVITNTWAKFHSPLNKIQTKREKKFSKHQKTLPHDLGVNVCH